MKLTNYLSLVVGLGWPAADIYLFLFISPISLRETRIGWIATFLDKLPPKLGNPIFIFLWFILLLGWLIPTGFGLKPLFRRGKAN
jgi:hypothetical protein